MRLLFLQWSDSLQEIFVLFFTIGVSQEGGNYG